MAKPRPVKGIDPDPRLRPNARRILAVRIDEVYAYDGLVADPRNVTDLHDMRIAFKRLRYLLEIFGIAFRDRPGAVPGAGQAPAGPAGRHPRLRRADPDARGAPGLARRARGRGRAARWSPRRRRIGGAGRPTEEEFRAFQHRLEVGRRADERLGVHALIGRRRRERNDLYARFIDEWRRLRPERFRRRLEAALGIGAVR